MFRIRVFLIATIALTAAFGATAQEDRIGERDVARPGGAYATLTIADAAACAQLCSRDGLCMAWTQRSDGMCELKAVIPPPVATAGARSGLSVRAPEFARHVALPALSIAPPPTEAPDTVEPPATRSELALLGGPEDGDDTLRLRFGRGP